MLAILVLPGRHGELLAQSTAADAPPPSVLRIGAWQNASLTFAPLHPIQKAQELDYAHQFVYRPLLAIDGQGKWQCVLCEKIPSAQGQGLETVGNKKAGQLLTKWRVRSDLKWGDGTPLTAADIFFSFTVAKALALASLPVPAYVATIDNMELDKKDPLAFSIKYTGAFADFYQMEDFFVIPKHLEDNAWQSSEMDLDEYFAKSNYYKNPFFTGLFNGPYLPTEKLMGPDNIVLSKNTHFPRAEELVDQIKIVRVANAQAAKQLLVTDKIDILAEKDDNFWAIMGLEKELKAGINSASAVKSSMQFVYSDNDVFETLVFNLRNPILADSNVRKALLAAIDRKQIVQSLFAGANASADSFLHPRGAPLSERAKLQSTQFSTTAAEELFAGAGWKKEPGAEFLSKEGQLFNLDLVVIKDHTWRNKVATQLQSQWRKVGVNLKITEASEEEFYKKIVPKAHFASLIFLGWQLPPEAIPRAFMHTKEIPGFENDYYGQNVGAWRNKRVDTLLEKMTRTFEASERESMQGELASIYNEEVPGIPLFHGIDAAILNARVENFRLVPHRQSSALWAENWRLK